MRERAMWGLRILWFLLPLSLGAVASDLVADDRRGVRILVTAALWVAWALGLAAAAVPLPVGLTTIRIVGVASVGLALWGLVEDVRALSAIAIVHALAVASVVMNSLIGDRFVDGASYGNERRMLLRPPIAASVGAVPIAGALTIAGLVIGPLLLTTQRWLSGAVFTMVGLPVVFLGARVLYQLTHRWVVFVPNGFVLHDLNVLTEPVLFRRTAVERLGPAIEGTPARDLSLQAPGLMIECELTDPAPLGLRSRDRRAGAEAADVRRFLIAPSRPGALLDEAVARRIPVG